MYISESETSFWKIHKFSCWIFDSNSLLPLQTLRIALIKNHHSKKKRWSSKRYKFSRSLWCSRKFLKFDNLRGQYCVFLFQELLSLKNQYNSSVNSNFKMHDANCINIIKIVKFIKIIKFSLWPIIFSLCLTHLRMCLKTSSSGQPKANEEICVDAMIITKFLRNGKLRSCWPITFARAVQFHVSKQTFHKSQYEGKWLKKNYLVCSNVSCSSL